MLQVSSDLNNFISRSNIFYKDSFEDILFCLEVQLELELDLEEPRSKVQVSDTLCMDVCNCTWCKQSHYRHNSSFRPVITVLQ